MEPPGTPLCNPACPTREANSSLLPRLLHSLSLIEPWIVRAILQRVSSSGHQSERNTILHALRGANQLLRTTVNSTVVAVALELCGKPHRLDLGCVTREPTSDLGVTFPNAIHLTADLLLAASPSELVHSLSGLVELCPALLSRLQHLELHLRAEHAESEVCLSSLNQLLSRCCALELLSVTISGRSDTLMGIQINVFDFGGTNLEPAVHIRFSGQGSTASDRVCLLQSQLAAFCTLPNFLHPACWPAYPCFTYLSLDNLHALPASSMFHTCAPPFTRMPSLESLHVHLPRLPALPSDEAQDQLSTLVRLTYLHVNTSSATTSHMQRFWDAAGALSSLRTLSIQHGERGDDNHDKASSFAIPATWTALHQLTSITFNDVYVSDPAALSAHLPSALRELYVHASADQVAQVVTHSAQLPSLTKLRIRSTPDDALEHHSQQDRGASAPAGACLAYRNSSTLQDLDVWHVAAGLACIPLQKVPGLTQLSYNGCYEYRQPARAFPDSHVLPLAGLKLLRKLQLQGVMVTQELCWALSQLPLLESCGIAQSGARPSKELTSPGSSSGMSSPLRVHSLCVDRWDVLSFFVMHSRLPSTSDLQLQLGDSPAYLCPRAAQDARGEAVRFDVQAASHINKSWLEVLLVNQVPIDLYITQGSCLGSLIPSFQGYRGALSLTLQSDVGPSLLGAVAAGYGGDQLAVRVMDRPPDTAGHGASHDGVEHEPEMGLRPMFTDEHLQAIVPHMAQLNSLKLSNCMELSSRTLQQVVESVGDGLTRLVMCEAKNVTNQTLWALLRSCRQLQHLELSGASEVTEAGVAPLVVMLRPAFRAEFTGTGMDWVKLQEEVEKHGGCCVVDAKGAAVRLLTGPDQYFGQYFH